MIAGIMRRWNDVLPDAERTRLLLPYLTMVVGTRSTADGIERRRRSKLTVWTVQSMLPLWLDLVGETHGAALLRNHLSVTPKRGSWTSMPHGGQSRLRVKT